MRELHPTSEELELYVIGAQDAVEATAIERHVSDCETCARDLREHAVLELKVEGFMKTRDFCVGCERVVAGDRCAWCGVAGRAGKYEIERVLVQGDLARVYAARDPSGNKVALKELSFTHVPSFAMIEAFEREGRVLAQLSHPSIPRFVASFVEGEGAATRLYLAQELIGGESLMMAMARHRFVEEEAVKIAAQVLSTLVYLQSLSPQVFHRDIKPANLIQRSGDIALVDFGAVRELGATTNATCVGTFGYMPPEQMVGIVGPSTDLYALGVTLTQLLTREPPFAEDVASTMRRLNVSAAFGAFLRKLCAEKVKDRFPSAAAALSALEKLDRGRRSKGPAIMAIAAIAAMGIGGGTIAALRAQYRRTEAKIAYPTSQWAAHRVESRESFETIVRGLRSNRKVDLAFDLERDYAAAMQEIAPRDGSIVFGRIVVDSGAIDPRYVVSQSPIREDGWFVTAVKDLRGVVQFRGNGLQAADLDLRELPHGAVINAGVLSMELLPRGRRATIRGRISVLGKSDVLKTAIEVRPMINPWTPSGTWRASIPHDPERDDGGAPLEPTVVIDRDGSYEISNLAPGAMQIAFDLADCYQRVVDLELAAGESTRADVTLDVRK